MSERSWVESRLGAPEFEALATGLRGTELHSVLLAVMQRRAQGRSPRDVLAQYQRDKFCSPAPVDLRTSVAVDAHLLEAAAAFEALELSPVAPLGTCSTVALTDQNRVLSSLRMTEVVSDPTNVLALECALRLRDKPGTPVHLTSVQRVVRAQPVPSGPGYSQHFRIFVLASGGQEEKDHGFSVSAVVLHVQTMCRGLDRLELHGYAFGRRRIEILTTPERRGVGERVVQQLGSIAVLGALDHAYYSGGLRYKVWVTAPDGTEIALIDGGTFDWLAILGSNRRAVYVASGTGAQLIAMLFQCA